MPQQIEAEAMDSQWIIYASCKAFVPRFATLRHRYQVIRMGDMAQTIVASCAVRLRKRWAIIEG